MDCWKADARNLVYAKTAYFDDELSCLFILCLVGLFLQIMHLHQLTEMSAVIKDMCFHKGEVGTLKRTWKNCEMQCFLL